MARISIIGSGFGALTAARALRRFVPSARITLVAPAPELIYHPSLIWIPSGLRTGTDLRVDLRRFLREQNIDFHAGHMRALRDAGRVVITEDAEVHNDGLVIASGGRFIRKLPGIEHAVTICEGISAAESLRERLQSLDGGTIAFGFGANPQEPQAMRGGPMFELLLGVDTLLRRQGRRDRFRLLFFSPAARPGQRLGEHAVARLFGEMRRRDIDTHLGHKLLGFERDRVRTEAGDIAADLILFMPGMTGPAWAEASGLRLSPGGFFAADAHCRADAAERIYVAGDAGSYPGPDWMPKQAHMADLQARTAARNLAADLRQKPAVATFRTELVCVIDALDRGILVYRNSRRAMVVSSRLLHWVKRFFEWLYLRRYRRAPTGGPGHSAAGGSS